MAKGDFRRGKEFAPRQFCRICGSRFYAPPALLRRPNGGRYCSTRCSNSRQKYAKQRSLPLNGTLELRRCVQCGEPLKTKFASKYCSKACFGKSNVLEGTWITKKCETCQKEFQAYSGAKEGQERFCSKECCWRQFGNRPNQPHSPRGRGGKRIDLDNQYFRSRWEANWARYLNWMQSRNEILAWKYEPDTFEFAGIKRGSRFYTPDFWVLSRGSIEYHEVKGWMDPKSQTKLKRMAKYHPHIKIVLVDKSMYQSVKKNLAAMIPGWEE